MMQKFSIRNGYLAFARLRTSKKSSLPPLESRIILPVRPHRDVVASTIFEFPWLSHAPARRNSARPD